MRQVKHAYYLRNRERIIERSRQHYANRDPQAHSFRDRKRMLHSKYQITPEQYEKMLLEQAGVCKICGNPPNGRWQRLQVDHDHSTGAKRGLLCSGCNLRLGWFETHQTAIKNYLRKEVQMDQSTLNLILFAEQLATLAAKTIVDLKGVLTGAGGKTTDEILADADATYNQIIANATNPPAPPTPTTPAQ